MPSIASAPTLSRRSAVRVGAGGLAATLATRGLAKPAAAQPASATFVLVHGSWAGAWIWRDLIRVLREAGHAVYASTATGMGDRAHLANAAIDLDVFIADVVNLLEFEDLTNVTLVGWSFGGMTITGVAERVPERLKQVVYLDSEVPADGQNFYDTGFVFEGAFVSEGAEEARAAAITGDSTAGVEAGTPGFQPVFPGIADWLHGALKDPAVADWVFANLRPHPLLTMLQPVKLGNPAAAALPRAYVLCTADKDLTAKPQTDLKVLAAERARSDPNWRVVEVADGHLAAVNSPELTAEALLSLV
jgi:pimeloyl-ACP methyl ester carboxylesterase